MTLAIDPRATGDVGWQLSFAAVLGILLLAAPLGRLLGGPGPGPAAPGACRGGVADDRRRRSRPRR